MKEDKKKKTEKENTASIIQNSLEDIMADRFARYSKYIIQERALPDARDGLKPVQRRILYAMYEAGNLWDKPYHKSAKTVGNVIGNYHPHGDSSVYNAMVRLSQPWKINLPLIDMQGNNGSIDDDPAAAMRYTECRLAAISQYLLHDLDKETVEWAPNFSDEKMEPTLLPAAYPNLLTHGISGIAAGYATNIPPHNLAEVIDAAILRIQNPKCTLQELMQIVQGPDFPTGGMVLSTQGIEQAFSTGKGKIFIRAKADIEQTRTIQQIVITEIPYEVVKSSLVKRMDDLRLNGSLSGVLDIRDESGRQGLRIVVDVKKEAPAQEILNYLYKNSDLQISYTYNMIAIVNKTPVLVSLPAALDAFIDHRKTIITRRSQYDLQNAKARAHVLEGLVKAMSVLDEIIALIRSSKDKAESKQKIQSAFGFSPQQAEAIVSMRLYRLSNTDVVALQQEAAALEKEIRRLEGILKSPARLKSLMVKELQEVKKAFPTPRKTRISSDSAVLVVDEAAMIPDETVMVSLSADGYIKRSSLRSFSSSAETLSGHKESDTILGQSQAGTRQHMVIFTDKGRLVIVPVYTIPEARWKDLGAHLSSLAKTDTGEKIAAGCIVPEWPSGVEIIGVSANGMLKRTRLDLLSTLKTGKILPFMKVSETDRLQSVLFSTDRADRLFLATRNGMGLQFAAADIPSTGLKARGVIGMNLEEGDAIAASALAPNAAGQFLLWSDAAGLKRIKAADFQSAARRSKGTRLFKKDTKKPVLLAGMLPVSTASPLPFDGMQETRAGTISLTSAKASGFTALPGLEQIEPVQPLPLLDKAGDWQEEESQPAAVQPSLFGE